MNVMSMTGCGRGDASDQGVTVEVEISTVNRKQLDVKVQIPRAFSGLEPVVQETIAGSFGRGFISVGVRIQVVGRAVQEGIVVDMDLAEAYLKKLRAMGKVLKIADDLTLSDIVRLPDILQQKTSAHQVEVVKDLLVEATTKAIRAVRGMRAKEGTALGNRLKQHLRKLEGLKLEIEKAAPAVSLRQREGMIRRLAEVGVTVSKEDPSLQKEMLLFSDRSDITEEITRLSSHFQQFYAMLKASEPMGRSMDFLCQELLREGNTIGSKANDTNITRHVIAFKAELEALREQVQNIE